ncbi:MAG: excinuclease ABC subunit A [Elusimicrobia bacterium RIFCSPLOWO2_02_FULL_39_32]|nr:MAG: excinuclease ABC subunit A [Elusimicrobia bacterium RIFCSPHIGHO2_02_FULL_39_36]OGR91074.1 MAG: excinuclease ABC subunit A [Elusimicrobia bacterium RIFCSPLOWO2_02_FULL_39_32]OGS00041.1 MAG: excinuclease ABC subunit A [Elusimicrobia bacterium RIFCSPLOWO2_12_FULL_39_28]
MPQDFIFIKGAREHNLKNISLKIPRNKLVVITGLSGSGKSSLAFDTLYAEGQRRYVESLSAYARQFLEMMDKPDVDLIEGLSPAIAIEQRNPSHNPRSTVGTVTEIYDYLRLLFARVGTPYCPQCKKLIQPQSASQIISVIMELKAGTKIEILSPLIRGRIGTYGELFQKLKRSGYSRARVNGKNVLLEEKIPLDRYKKHTIELVVDRVEIQPEIRERIADSIETALKEGNGVVEIIEQGKKEPLLFSERYACTECGISLPEIEPRMFSFNSPYGACPECDGIGSKVEVDPDLVVPEKDKSILEGAIIAWNSPVTTRTHRWKQGWREYYDDILKQVCDQYRIGMGSPWKNLSENHKKILLYGGANTQIKSLWGREEKEFEGVIGNLERRYTESESEFVKEEIMNLYMRRRTCPKCKGARLKNESLSVKIGQKNIQEISQLSVKKAKIFFDCLKLGNIQEKIAKTILKEIVARLEFLENVGLDYLTLSRESQTLAGGEAQRIHLATQIGSGLMGVLYVLDEPSIGLHQRDNKRLLDTLIRLKNLGNTLVVVEHDEETIRSADWIIDLGPGAGEFGGEVIAQGTLPEILKEKKSLTASYLNGNLKIPLRKAREQNKKAIKIFGASQFNLKNIDLEIPLGVFVCVTGVSGSGKSTLVHEIIYKSLALKLHHSKDLPGKARKIEGFEHLDKVIVVDQSPIGRTPRSNPATYTGAWAPIREVFAQLQESRRKGYKPGRFSFNVKGGRCENCQGDGTLKISMQFLPDIYVKCEVCEGKRFNQETLQIKFKGKNIAEVLNLPVEEALIFFQAIPQIARTLQTLQEVGLGYIKLGQSATTLSGGEAQRVKLATELSKRATGKTLYLLDEPTTGLHFADVEKLLNVLHKLVEIGNSVLVIEHNLEVIKTADWIVDMGPEGGDLGGSVVAEGSPKSICENPLSYTGQFLKKLLN